uniref:ADP,ATP carrier protein n=1 Tax=Hanusia phi TaxID=3032 RepID=A0A6T7T3K1_9CRYP|mmetsp:Transcript_4990/g.11782  ORF Transcript_4990/g.11782 Transcript_4990/m.11782 type:complete len:199 (+) Transcript_4990:69-665(+)
MQDKELKELKKLQVVKVNLEVDGHARRCKLCATVSGATAGAVGVMVGQPFDTLKVRLQVSSAKGIASKDNMSFLKTLAMYYRGSGPPIISSGLVSSLNFTGFEAIKHFFHREEMSRAPLSVHWISGFGGAVPITVITCPSQNIKILQQAGDGNLGMIDCMRKILKTSGLRGLYRGYCVHSILETFGDHRRDSCGKKQG